MRSTFLWIFFLATASGCLVGIVGAAFRFLIEHGYLGFIDCTRAIAEMGYPAWPAATLAGAALVSLSVFLTRRFAPEAAGSGIQWMEGTIKGVLPPVRWWRILPVKFVGGVSAMTAGMVLGREGPTIHLGGAIGAMLGRFAEVSDEHRHALIAASAGAGLAVAFNAPAGGILFVAEEMRDDIAYTNIVASYVIIASIMAVAISGLILGFDRILPMPSVAGPSWVELALAVGFGLIVGFYGAFLNAALLYTVERLRRITDHLGWGSISITVGGVTGLLVALFADATGGGEMLAARLITVDAPAPLVVLLLARTLLFLVNYGTGTPGGIFAPQLAFGAMLGLLFSAAVDAVAPGLITEPTRFAVTGMAALLTATVRAPLTGMILVVEMTGSIELLFMMLVASLAAATTALLLGAQPIYRAMLDRLVRGANGQTSERQPRSST
jgi:CIC family chloride channel protein